MLKSNLAEKTFESEYEAKVKTTSIFTPDEEVQAFLNLERRESDLVYSISKKIKLDTQRLLKEIELPDQVRHSLESGKFTKDVIHKLVTLLRPNDVGRAWLSNLIESYGKSMKCYNAYVKLRNKIATANLRLVFMFVRKFYRTNTVIQFDDLVQEGNFGILRAIDRFDVRKGFKFSTYAIWWVRHHIKRYVTEKADLVKTPIHFHDNFKVVSKLRSAHMAMTGEDISIQDLVKSSGLTEKQIEILHLRRPRSYSSLNAPIGDSDGSDSMIDLLHDPEAKSPQDIYFDTCSERKAIELLTYLTPMESKIMKLRFGIGCNYGMTLQEIANIVCLTRERVRQIEFKSLKKLKHQLLKSGLVTTD